MRRRRRIAPLAPGANVIRNARELPEQYREEIEAAAERALGAGARPPLSYVGMGMTGIVFSDRTRNLAYKVARSTYARSMLAEEPRRPSGFAAPPATHQPESESRAASAGTTNTASSCVSTSTASLAVGRRRGGSRSCTTSWKPRCFPGAGQRLSSRAIVTSSRQNAVGAGAQSERSWWMPPCHSALGRRSCDMRLTSLPAKERPTNVWPTSLTTSTVSASTNTTLTGPFQRRTYAVPSQRYAKQAASSHGRCSA